MAMGFQKGCLGGEAQILSPRLLIIVMAEKDLHSNLFLIS
jgi:hypothetical protein